jgi:hypothetical protein
LPSVLLRLASYLDGSFIDNQFTRCVAAPTIPISTKVKRTRNHHGVSRILLLLLQDHWDDRVFSVSVLPCCVSGKFSKAYNRISCRRQQRIFFSRNSSSSSSPSPSSSKDPTGMVRSVSSTLSWKDFLLSGLHIFCSPLKCSFFKNQSVSQSVSRTTGRTREVMYF